MKPKVNDDVLVQLKVIAEGENDHTFRVAADHDSIWIDTSRIEKIIVKKYVLPLDGTCLNGKYLFAVPVVDGEKYEWSVSDDIRSLQEAATFRDFLVTKEQLKSAPAWIKAIPPVEVQNEDC